MKAFFHLTIRAILWNVMVGSFRNNVYNIFLLCHHIENDVAFGTDTAHEEDQELSVTKMSHQDPRRYLDLQPHVNSNASTAAKEGNQALNSTAN